jgi:hypothetical protein
MSWVNVGIAAAGMMAKYKADKDAQGRSESLRNSMQTYQLSKAGQTEQAINQLMTKQTPDARAAELQGIEKSSEASMQGTVDAARAASPVLQVAGTNTSGDYQKANQAAATRVADKTNRAIQQLGTMGAPGEQGVASGLRFGRAAGNVDANNMAIANVGDAYMRDINNVRPDPMLSLVGDAAIAYGSAGAGSAAAAPAAAGGDAAAFEGGAWLGGDGGAASAAAKSTAASRAAAMRTALSKWGR